MDDPGEREERDRLAGGVAKLAQILGHKTRHHQHRGGHRQLEERRDVRVLDPADRPPVDALEDAEPDAGGGRPQDAAHARDTGAIFWPFACSTVPPK